MKKKLLLITFYPKHKIIEKTFLGLLLTAFILILSTNEIVAQTTVNLAPCTNCNTNTDCLPAKYEGSLGGSIDFSTASTNAAAPTIIGTPLVFTVPKEGWINLQFNGSTSQTGGAAAAENTQVTFYLRLDGNNVQTSSYDAIGEHGSLGVNRTINYDVDLDRWQYFTAGTYTLSLGAVRHANLDRGSVAGSLTAMTFPNCGFGGSGNSATTDTIYIASDTCVAARVVHDVAQNLPAATTTQLNFGTETYDFGSNFNANQFTVPEDGLYFINGQISTLLSNESDWTRLFIYKNGASLANETEINGRASNSSVSTGINTTVPLNAGDIIDLHAYVTTASPTQANRGYFEVRRVDCGSGNASSTDTLYIAGESCKPTIKTNTGLSYSGGAGVENIIPSSAINLDVTDSTLVTFRLVGTHSSTGASLSQTVYRLRHNGVQVGINQAADMSGAGPDLPVNNVFTLVVPPGNHTFDATAFLCGSCGNNLFQGMTQLVARSANCGDGTANASGSSTPSLSYNPTTDSLSIADGNTISIAKTPTYGVDDLDSDFTITSTINPGHNLASSLAVTLPEAGTYRVTANTFGDIRTTSGTIVAIQATLWDNTNASAIGNTFYVVGTDDSGDRNRGGSTYERFITVTAPTQITLTVYRQNNATDICILKSASQILYEKID